MLKLSVLLEDSARTHPTRDAVVLGDARLSYAQVDAAANQVANLMDASKYPRTIEFRDCLPMTATGKILKRELV